MSNEFEDFIQTVEEEMDKCQIALCEDLKKFINAVDERIRKTENKKEVDFKNFINSVQDYICKTVKNWNKKEKKLFELLFETVENRMNILEAFGYQESPYRDILVWLLNPKGSHAHKDKFARIFLDYVAKKGDTEGNTNLIDNSLGDLEVKSELNNIDFVLYGKNLDFFCAVEMKIGAGEGKNQTKNYEEKFNMDDRFKDKSRKFFIYLDPKVLQKPLTSGKFKVMNWWDLCFIFTEIYDDANFFIKDIIRQFIARVFTFVEEMQLFNERERILTKKRWFEIYKEKKGEQDGKAKTNL